MTPGAGEPVIRVRDLHKTYGQTRAVDGVSFEARRWSVARRSPYQRSWWTISSSDFRPPARRAAVRSAGSAG